MFERLKEVISYVKETCLPSQLFYSAWAACCLARKLARRAALCPPFLLKGRGWLSTDLWRQSFVRLSTTTSDIPATTICRKCSSGSRSRSSAHPSTFKTFHHSVFSPSLHWHDVNVYTFGCSRAVAVQCVLALFPTLYEYTVLCFHLLHRERESITETIENEKMQWDIDGVLAF